MEKEPEALKFDFSSSRSLFVSTRKSQILGIVWLRWRGNTFKENIFSLDKNYFRNFPFFEGERAVFWKATNFEINYTMGL